jgi:hypothetical protein
LVNSFIVSIFISEIKIDTEMEYKIIHSGTAESLSNRVMDYIKEGWETVGSHYVVVTHQQNRFRGDQLVDTISTLEYSQTIIKK